MGRFRWIGIALLVVVGLLASACGGVAPPPTPPGQTETRLPTSAASTPPRAESLMGIRVTEQTDSVTWSGARVLTVTDQPAGTFLAWSTSVASNHDGGSELARVNRQTGAFGARRHLAGQFVAALSAGGTLWVVEDVHQQWRLLRLSPATLAVLSVHGGGGTSLAVAGGQVWVAGGSRLERFALRSGAPLAGVPLPGTASSSVGTNAAGTALVVAVADAGGRARLERRNPRTGALLATSSSFLGVTSPSVGGIADGSVWMAESTGMQGYVQRYALATMRPVGGACSEGGALPNCERGSNGSQVRVTAGVVWITQASGGPARNVCLDEQTSRRLAALPGLPASQAANENGVIVGVIVGVHALFDLAGEGRVESITERAFPPACRARD